MRGMAELTPRQQRFVAEYLIDLNATAAYKRAGYKAAGRAAENNASRLLGNAGVAEAIAAAQHARAERVGLTSDEVLRELKVLGTSSVLDYAIDELGNVALAPGVPAEAIRAVSSIKRKVRHLESGTEYETEIRLWDKNSALEKAGKHLGLWRDAAVAAPVIVVVEDAGWYANDAHAKAGAAPAQGPAAPAAGAAARGKDQGGGVR